MEDKKYKVMIDPGHGGKDPGAVGKLDDNSLFYEKHATLALSSEIAFALRTGLAGHIIYNRYSENFQVATTRDRDEYVGLTKRCNIANNWGASLFLSLHFNAHREDADPTKARGWTVYYYKGSKEGASLAMRIAKSMETFLVQTGFPPFPKNRGGVLDNESFRVLKGTSMPAVLIECGFLTNKADLERLAHYGSLIEVGDSIANGIYSYCYGVGGEIL